MNNIMVKNISTMFFIAFLMVVALVIPTSALFNNPIFHNDEVQFYYLNSNQVSLHRTKGFSITNVEAQEYLVAKTDKESKSLYDLYLSFDENSFTNNYTIIKNDYETNISQKKVGRASAKFVTGNDSIVLFPNTESILKSTTSVIPNFTITFQLYPYRVGEGAQYVASYEGFYVDPIIGMQTIGFSISIESGIVYYHIKNLFVDDQGFSHSFTLRENKPLVNNKWERHTMVVDSAKGVIKIYRNNNEEDIVFLRVDELFNGKRLYISPQFSQLVDTPLTIGKNGVFSLDDFAIYQDAVTNFMEYTANEKLFFETEVFQISKNISSLYEMDIIANLTNAHYRIAYRINDKYFLPEMSTTVKPWIYIDPKQKKFPLSYTKGKFMQWRVEYFTPLQPLETPFMVRDVFARFKETSNPGTIQVENVIAKDGSIEIKWQTLPNDLISSYEIYYGESPSNYFGKSTVSPASPIEVDVNRASTSQSIQYQLEGLDNEKSYYISIRAKDIYGQYGPFSPEIVSRPSSVNNNLGFSIGR